MAEPSSSTPRKTRTRRRPAGSAGSSRSSAGEAVSPSAPTQRNCRSEDRLPPTCAVRVEPDAGNEASPLGGLVGPASNASVGSGVLLDAARDLENAGRKARTAITQLRATTARMTAVAILQTRTPAGSGVVPASAAWPADCPGSPLNGVLTLRQAQRMRKKPREELLGKVLRVGRREVPPAHI